MSACAWEAVGNCVAVVVLPIAVLIAHRCGHTAGWNDARETVLKRFGTAPPEETMTS